MNRPTSLVVLGLFAITCFLGGLAGCAPSRDRNTFFEKSLERPDGQRAKLFARNDVRLLLSQQDTRISDSLEDMFKGKVKDIEDIPGQRGTLPLRMLALSGGVQWGAYGAGFLQAWHKDRAAEEEFPNKFDVVTGVSTGALQATFAFIDDTAAYKTLAGAYTSITDFGDVVDHDWNFLTGRVALAAITGDSSLYTTRKLRQRIQDIITPEILYQVKAGYQEHRRLFVATTNLDISRSWVWDLTKVASLLPDDPKADPQRVAQVQKLYVDILLASSAMPVLFPPVCIDSSLLDTEGSLPTSGFMHCDGGVTRNVFVENFISAITNASCVIDDNGEFVCRLLDVDANLFVLINGKVAERASFVEGSYFTVGGSAISTVLNERMIGNIFFLQDMINQLNYPDDPDKLNGLEFKGTVRIESIPTRAAEFDEDRGDEIGLFSFDNKVMRRLYDAGKEAWARPDLRFRKDIRAWHAALREDQGQDPPALLQRPAAAPMK